MEKLFLKDPPGWNTSPSPACPVHNSSRVRGHVHPGKFKISEPHKRYFRHFADFFTIIDARIDLSFRTIFFTASLSSFGTRRFGIPLPHVTSAPYPVYA